MFPGSGLRSLRLQGRTKVGGSLLVPLQAGDEEWAALHAEVERRQVAPRFVEQKDPWRQSVHVSLFFVTLGRRCSLYSIGGPWFTDMSCREAATSKSLGSTAL